MTPRPYNGDRPLEARVSVLESKVEDIRRTSSDTLPRPEFQIAHALLDAKISALKDTTNKLTITLLAAFVMALVGALLALSKH